MEVRASHPTHDTHSMTWVGIMDFEYRSCSRADASTRKRYPERSQGKALHGGFFSLPRISILATLQPTLVSSE